VERLAREGFNHKSGVGRIVPENDHAGIVFIHRKPAVVLRPLHFADVLPFAHGAQRYVSSVGDCAVAEIGYFASIDENGSLVIDDDVA
jgi:hypothetical protein